MILVHGFINTNKCTTLKQDVRNRRNYMCEGEGYMDGQSLFLDFPMNLKKSIM